MICSVPALRALRTTLPQAEIVLLALGWARSFVTRFSRYVDGFIELPGYPGFSERTPAIHQLPNVLQQIQSGNFDLAIQMHGSGVVSNPLIALLGAKRTAGFFTPGQYCPDPERFLPYPAGEHEVRRLLRLVEFLGCKSRGEQLEFPLTGTDEKELAAIEEARELETGRFVCVHPGARSPARRWNPEGFAAAADVLAEAGFRVVLTGSVEEAELTRTVAELMRAPAVNLAPHPGLSLGALAALLSRARLLLSNDTGIAHVAAALGVSSVVVFTASDPKRWAPLDRSRHQVVVAPVDCRPCTHDVCPIGHPCAHRVAPEAVIAGALRLLEKDAAHAA
jgi:ADP-heptose:LPS heptosyltransferase